MLLDVYASRHLVGPQSLKDSDVMAGLFSGKTGLNTIYCEVSAANLATAAAPASAFYFAKTAKDSHIGLLSNGTSASIVILVVHPDADWTNPEYRLKLIELPPNTPLNLDTSFGMNLTIDAQTKILAYVSAGTVQPGEKLRAFFW